MTINTEIENGGRLLSKIKEFCIAAKIYNIVICAETEKDLSKMFEKNLKNFDDFAEDFFRDFLTFNKNPEIELKKSGKFKYVDLKSLNTEEIIKINQYGILCRYAQNHTASGKNKKGKKGNNSNNKNIRCIYTYNNKTNIKYILCVFEENKYGNANDKLYLSAMKKSINRLDGS